MISRLCGTLIEIAPQSITLDVHDVGYNIYVSDQWLKNATIGNKYTLYIYTHVKEDALELFGFANGGDRALFGLLLSVSGIGPKTALSIIGYGAKAIQTAVSSADVEFFSSIPRIGKKNAQKIIIELKTKLGSVVDLDLSIEQSGKRQELFEALISMGFARNEIQDVIKKELDEEKSIEENLKKALRLLAKT
jgi:Holliday junction DNA helicase RuvA